MVLTPDCPLSRPGALPLPLVLIAALCLAIPCRAGLDAGPLYQDFKLTLQPGHRTEVLGPLFYSQRQEATRTWALPGLLSHHEDPLTDYEEFQALYPIITYNRYGPEYRFQLFQLFSFSGGQTLKDSDVDRFTLFPFYFQQRSDDPALNYTAVFPFYGTLKNRLFRDELHWIMWPAYVVSRRRTAASESRPDEFLALPYRFARARKGDITTYNFLAPFFHLRYGDGLRGWQFWPLAGHEHKEITYRTNMWDEVELVGGHDRRFALWPIFFQQRNDLGTTNASRHQVLLPFYSVLRSPARDATSYGWPLGVNVVDDRAREYRELDIFWPLIVFARGEGKSGNRVLPFFSVMRNREQVRRLYAWPIYREAHLHVPPLDRNRRRILYFLYSDLVERNLETTQSFRRVDAWPFFTFRRDFDGRSQLQVLALLEPLLPASESIERNYSPLWALWRSRKNSETGATSQSLLWNTYRRETTPLSKKCSLLFGLFQYQSTPAGKELRLFHVPLMRPKAALPDPSEVQVH